MGPMNPATGHEPPGGRPGSLAWLVVRAPLTARTRRALLFCLTEAALGLVVLAVPFGLLALLVVVQRLTRGTTPPNLVSAPAVSDHPAGALLYLVVLLAVLLLVVFLAPRFGRGLGTVHRLVAARLLGERVGEPTPARRGHGVPERAPRPARPAATRPGSDGRPRGRGRAAAP